MATEAQARREGGWLQSFTAVDLITIAIFAVLLRFVFFYIYRALYVAFPWNQAVFPLFMTFTLATLLAIVPKLGTTTLFTVAWQLINLFFQGEELIYLVMYIPVPILTELAFYMMKRYGDDVRSALVGNVVYIGVSTVVNYVAIVYVFLITEYTIPIALAVLGLSVVVATPIGTVVGNRLGLQLRRLIP